MDLHAWRFDAPLVLSVFAAAALYTFGVRVYQHRRAKPWPRRYAAFFAAALASLVLAAESPLDAAGDAAFAPHMVQHLILTDLTAPLVLLGAPVLLLLGALSPAAGRRAVALMRSRVAHVLTAPLLTWMVFMFTLWIVHFSPFFEAALADGRIHLLEHALFIATALAFWLPIVPIGPVPWMDGPLAYPLRMLYLIVAMPSEAVLGFSIYSARHVLYPHYAAAGLTDQHFAGEIMWVGGSLAMFVAFMITGVEWARHDIRLAARRDAIEDAAEKRFTAVRVPR